MLGELRGSFPGPARAPGDLRIAENHALEMLDGAFPAVMVITAALEIRYNLGLHYAVRSFRGLHVVVATTLCTPCASRATPASACFVTCSFPSLLTIVIGEHLRLERTPRLCTATN